MHSKKSLTGKFTMEMYEKAIEGYQQHWEHYTRWMNHFAIFNGALFVGLYSTMNKEIIGGNYDFLLPYMQVFILALGCISSWFWLFCARGFYRWLCSWIKTVQEHEKRLKTEYFDDKSMGEIHVYNIFRTMNADGRLKTRPFSAQKITQWFAGSVSAVWSAITTIFFYEKKSELGCLISCLSILLIAAIITACGVWLCRESDLKESHLVV